MSLNKLQENLKYTFKDETTLIQAMTHTSYLHEHNLPQYLSYERWEYLGDAVLQFVVSEYLTCRYPAADEGVLSRRRAAVVCEEHLSQVAQTLELGQCALLGKGEEKNGGRQRKRLRCDLLESVTGAIYHDGGLEAVQEFIREHVLADEERLFMGDCKTFLQEAMGCDSDLLTYRVVSETGREHDKVFEVVALFRGVEFGRGTGHSKKAAEQQAAAEAMAAMYEE